MTRLPGPSYKLCYLLCVWSVNSKLYLILWQSAAFYLLVLLSQSCVKVARMHQSIKKATDGFASLFIDCFAEGSRSLLFSEAKSTLLSA